MRTRQPFGLALLAAALLVGFGPVGCAALGSTSVSPAAPVAMDQARLELVFSQQVDAIEGPSGAIRTIHEGVEIYLISDPENDRMRLLSRIADASQVDPRVFNILLQANFFLTLDARYAVSDGIIFAAYTHPMSSLTEEDLAAGVAQVIALAKNFGTTYSAMPLDFGVGQ